MTITPQELAGMIDHTLLKADATKEQFSQLCAEARDYGFAMVAINPYPVRQCAQELAGTGVHVGAAIGFPLGQVTIEDKVSETKRAIENGADEIDYVINITELKAGNDAYIEEEMSQIVDACRANGVLSKVIFENCYLTDEEKRRVATIAATVRPDFIKTSTGFGTGGATLEDVQLMKGIVGDKVQVKAAGGVRDLDSALAFIAAGVTRLGSSSGVKLVDELRARTAK
ncbi:MAG: deoxyribose-phosphate aldolase [Ancrocorticia sp.]|uniref:deoxyribose-phosphate aldolase n=1 Tax=Ancrocorticia sp. TaxID=2593684 RepID=UPI003F8FAD29